MGQIVYDIGGSWSSPELELNDIGFVSQTDNVSQWIWVQYRKLNPSAFLEVCVSILTNDRIGTLGEMYCGKSYNVNANGDFTNLWNFGTGINYYQEASNADCVAAPPLPIRGYMVIGFQLALIIVKKFPLMLTHHGNGDEIIFLATWGCGLL